MSTHEPDPSFLEHLEWQVRTEARRVERFAEPPVTRGGTRWLRTPLLVALLMALSAGLGAAGVTVVERVQIQREHQLVVKRAEVKLDMTRARLEQLVSDRERVDLLVQRAVVSKEAFRRAQELALLARFDKLRAERSLTEVRATRRAIDERLTAPLVDGRDFVAERVALDLLQARSKMQELVRQRKRLKKLSAQGIVSEREASAGRVELDLARAQARLHERRLGIRWSYLDGRLALDRALLEAVRVEARMRLEVAEAQLEAARERVQAYKHQVELGDPYGVQRELERAAEDLARFEAEVQLAEIELGLIDARLGGGDPVDFAQRFLEVEREWFDRLGLTELRALLEQEGATFGTSPKPRDQR